MCIRDSLYPAGILLGSHPAILAGAILSGAIFGDNLAPISDVTIASTTNQRFRTKEGYADIAGTVGYRLKYALIAGGIALVLFAVLDVYKRQEIAQSISVIFLFNVAAALLFPTLGGLLGLGNEGFGLFAGTAVNDTSSVTAAAAAWDGMHLSLIHI